MRYPSIEDFRKSDTVTLPEKIAEWINNQFDYSDGCPAITIRDNHIRKRFRCGAKVVAAAYKILREEYGCLLICNVREGIGAFEDVPGKIISRKIWTR